MKKLLFVKATLFFFCLISPLWGSAFNKRHDLQFWELQKLVCELNSNTSLYFQTEFRWGDDISVLYVSYLQGGVAFSPTKWLEVSPGYRHLSSLRTDHTRITVYEPLLDITFKWKLRDWEVQDRVRFQYRIPEIGFNEWIYRNRIRLASPWKWGRLKFNPFLSDEVFFRETSGFSENRFACGGRFTLNKTVQSELFYLLRHIQFPDWRPTHVIGMYLFFKY